MFINVPSVKYSLKHLDKIKLALRYRYLTFHNKFKLIVNKYHSHLKQSCHDSAIHQHVT